VFSGSIQSILNPRFSAILAMVLNASPTTTFEHLAP
jgi:hypothetical protein